MGMKNLTGFEQLRLYSRVFDCQVLGHPPCNKSRSPIKIISRAGFYSLGFLKALGTIMRSGRNKGQTYSQMDEKKV
jgi:hypothetical protein